MNKRYALFFILPFEELDKVPVIDNKNPPAGIRKIFHYFNMYICILDDNDLEKGSFTLDEVYEALAGKTLTEVEKKSLDDLQLINENLTEAEEPNMAVSKLLISRVKTKKIIEPIIRSILPGLGTNLRFQWMLTELDELKWSELPAVVKNPEGAAGGGSEE